MTISPNSPTFESEVEAHLAKLEEEYAIESFPAEHRNHLGASAIGEECWRKLWYQFRWVKLHHAEGRMRRLWNRGHREEPVFEGFLIWAGFSGKSIDPETDKQYKFSKCNGHFGGSTDGLWLMRFADNFPIIVEYKTFADKYFQELKKKKVKAAVPKYFAQMCAYGREFKVTHGLLYAVNKDNDELYRELVKLDWSYGLELEKKASDIINSPTPPPKINENASYYQCKFCNFSGICHYGENVEVNCRSCINAVPAEKGQWGCKHYNELIPKEWIGKGCPQHRGIV